MTNCMEFYELRDLRSVGYIGQSLNHGTRIRIVADADTCHSASGQLALLSLANQLARVHRGICFELAQADAPVVARTPFPGHTLGEVLFTTVNAIDPCGEFVVGPCPGASHSIGLGTELPGNLDWYIGADRAVAYLSRAPRPFSKSPSTPLGAGLAACLGCSAMLRLNLGLPTASRVLSAWNYLEGDAAAHGPSVLPAVDVGRVLMVGAGAVGASLAYWLHALGASGHGWVIVDGDVVELHNTNRSLPFTAKDAGWPSGPPLNKAAIVARLLDGASAYPNWYDDSPELHEQNFDVVLALANDRGVRRDLTHRNAVVALQATTGDNWLSQLHRHVIGRDGCIWCRTGEIVQSTFACSTGIVAEGNDAPSDAALPFLSAASGLMLASALLRLTTGELTNAPSNCWSWDFGSMHRLAARPGVRDCNDGCALILPPGVRRKMNSGSRWSALDADESALGASL